MSENNQLNERSVTLVESKPPEEGVEKDKQKCTTESVAEIVSEDMDAKPEDKIVTELEKQCDDLTLAAQTPPPLPWLTYGNITLTTADKSVIKAVEQPLTDAIVNCAQFILQNEWPLAKSMQNVSQEFAAVGDDYIETFVQIVKDSTDHWVVVSNVFCRDRQNMCEVFDSSCLVNGFDPKVKASVRQLMGAVDNSRPIECYGRLCTSQQFANQSALYAIAFAETLCSGGDPCDILFAPYPYHLRIHLYKCLNVGQFTRFPTSSVYFISRHEVIDD